MPADLQSILKLDVPLIVQISGKDVSVADVASLVPGAIIELPKQASEELEILIANKPIGLGTAVKVGENFGIKVTYIGDLKQRIAALGGKAPGKSASQADGDDEETGQLDAA